MSQAPTGSEVGPTLHEGERYHRGELLGLGGMGRVVLARDLRLGRDVALKEVAPDADPGLRTRLAREAAIAARLDHPGIVPIHDVGRRPDGTVFFAMRVVRGRSLGELAREAKGPERDRLFRAVLAAAEAVGWAHALGVVHRDLKPANIMIGEFGETQVVDWGLARGSDFGALPELEGVTVEDPALTQVGAIVGTPRYMAPEQARGQLADARSDVWSLGAILFDLVAGRAPYPGESSDDVLEAARKGEVPAVTSLAPETPPELAAIIDKALAPAPERRYADAKELAQDLGRYLDGRRVRAYAYSTWDLLRRVLRAWRAPLMVAGVALVALIVIIALSFAATERGRERAEAAEREAREALARADRHLSRALADEARTHAASESRPEAELLAAHALALGESPEARGILASLNLSPRPERLEERPLEGACARPVVGVTGRLGCRTTVSRPLRYVGRDLDARWDAGFLTFARAGRDLVTLSPCLGANIGAIAIDEPRARFAALCDDGRARVGDLATPETLTTSETPLSERAWPPTTAAFVHGADQLVVGTTSSRVLVLGLDGRVLRDTPSGVGPVREVDVSADGRVAAVLGERGGARLLDIERGAWIGRLPARWSRQVRFSLDAPRELWTLGPSLVRWRLPEPGTNRRTLEGGVTSFAVDRDELVVGHGAGVSIFELSSGTPRWHRGWPGGVTKSVAFLGASVIASNAGAQEVRRWSRSEGLPEAPFVGDEATRGRRVGVLETPAGPALVVLPYEGRLVAMLDGKVQTLAADTDFIDLAGTADGHTLYVLREAPRAACAVTAEPTPALGECVPDPFAHALALSPEGALLATAREREVLVSLTEDGSPLRLLATPAESSGHLTEVDLAPDLRLVAAGDRDGTTWVWRLSDGALVMSLSDHDERVSAVTFAGPTRLLTGSWDRTVRVRDLSLLDAEPGALVAAMERAWGLTLDEVVGRRGF